MLTAGRYGITIESLCNQIHKSLAKDFKYALVWGSSTKHSPQHSGIQHVLHDEDVVQIMKRTVQEEMHMKDRAITVQEHWNEWKRKKKGAAPGEKRKPLKS